VLGFLRKPLGDLCISRPASRLNWGIPLPFDTDYVCYVWFDALINYLTAAGYLSDEARFNRLWPVATHLIGKDILTLHAVYWPTMLHALGLSQPKAIVAHGWWVIDGAKISKSRGPKVQPLDLAGIYGADAFRYFLARGAALDRDAEFSEPRLAARYQGDLANDLGNLLHRVVNMIGRYHEGHVPEPGQPGKQEDALKATCLEAVQTALAHVEELALGQAVATALDAVGEVNGYLERTAPWREVKTDPARAATILYHAAEALRLLSVLLHPVLPERTAELWRRLGWTPPERLGEGLAWGRLRPGAEVVADLPLFPREVGS
jgi:methionyl-tRNA synthetase